MRAKRRNLLPIAVLAATIAALLLIAVSVSAQVGGYSYASYPGAYQYQLAPYPGYGYPYYVTYAQYPYYHGPYHNAVYTEDSSAASYGSGDENIRQVRWFWDHRGYDDPYEHYLLKRGPFLQAHPPYPSVVKDNEAPTVSPVKLSWQGANVLDVNWVGRNEPVKSINIEFTDRYNNVISCQSLTEAPFRVKLDVPEAASYLRVTVRYPDGGIASSAMPLN